MHNSAGNASDCWSTRHSQLQCFTRMNYRHRPKGREAWPASRSYASVNTFPSDFPSTLRLVRGTAQAHVCTTRHHLTAGRSTITPDPGACDQICWDYNFLSERSCRYISTQKAGDLHHSDNPLSACRLWKNPEGASLNRRGPHPSLPDLSSCSPRGHHERLS